MNGTKKKKTHPGRGNPDPVRQARYAMSLFLQLTLIQTSMHLGRETADNHIDEYANGHMRNRRENKRK